METNILTSRDNRTRIQQPSDLTAFEGELEAPPDGGMFSFLLECRSSGEIRPREEIIPGLARGEVGLVVSPTDGGKTSLLRNITADVTAGRKSGPLQGSQPAEKKYVYYLDFEDTLAGAIADFEIVFGDDLRDAADRLYLKVRPNYIDWDALENTFDIDDETKLSLSKEAHRKQIIEDIKTQSEWDPRDYALLIVDTIASGFDIEDENASATIANTVMKPLADIAVKANVAVLAAVHQSTKSTSRSIASHKIRGSTAFGDLARAIYQLTYDEETGEHDLRITKGKGVDFKPRRLRLEGRRFSVIEEIETPPTDYVRVRELLLTGEYSPSQISETLQIAKRTVERILGRGVKAGGFAKLKRGCYVAK